jgi:hypothetical protein
MSTIVTKIFSQPRLRGSVCMAIFVVFVLVSLSTTSCSSACGNQVIEQISSPDKTKTLYIFDRDCGATTDFVIHLAILDNSRKFGDGTVGNVFIADSNRGKVTLKVQTKWSSPSTIEIGYPSGSRVYKRKADVGGVRISYYTF